MEINTKHKKEEKFKTPTIKKNTQCNVCNCLLCPKKVYYSVVNWA